MRIQWMMMKSGRIVATLFALGAVVSTASAQEPKDNASAWRVKDLYHYLSAAGEDLSESDILRYGSFLRDSQDSRTGSFEDAHGTFVYSVKADALLQHFGFKSKYPLAVCEPPCRNETREEVSEQMSIAGFREWLDHLYQKRDAYGAGSLRGDFIAPHGINLQRAGICLTRKTPRTSRSRNNIQPKGNSPSLAIECALSWSALPA